MIIYRLKFLPDDVQSTRAGPARNVFTVTVIGSNSRFTLGVGWFTAGSDGNPTDEVARRNPVIFGKAVMVMLTDGAGCVDWFVQVV